MNYQPSILLLGGTETGKTHYGGQLLRRLQRQQGALKMVGVPSDMTHFQEVCDALAQGKTAPHTPLKIYRESLWRVSLTSSQVEAELVWPDYGGEQVLRLVRERQVSPEWTQRIQASNGWLLFIRLKLLKVVEDMLTRPRTLGQMQRKAETTLEDSEHLSAPNEKDQSEAAQSGEVSVIPNALSAQAYFVELLQTLLFVKQISTQSLINRPALTLVLSCWDEIPDRLDESGKQRPPQDLLLEHLPFFFNFVQANWASNVIEVLGLSALGKSLQRDIVDEDFVDNGPERQGYCVLPDGSVQEDLTLPVARLIGKLAST